VVVDQLDDLDFPRCECLTVEAEPRLDLQRAERVEAEAVGAATG